MILFLCQNGIPEIVWTAGINTYSNIAGSALTELKTGVRTIASSRAYKGTTVKGVVC